MEQQLLGIDMAKESFAVALVGAEGRNQGTFANKPAGFAKLSRWLAKHGADALPCCLEATGRYWEGLARYLHEAGHSVSVVNPKLIKRHAEATMQRNKTDRQDALTIADYGRKHQPRPWTPPSAAVQTLQELTRLVAALKRDRTRTKNRLQAGVTTPLVVATLKAQLAFLDEQLATLEAEIEARMRREAALHARRALITSIPGIGDRVAAVFLAEVPDVAAFQSASQLAAFAGLTPGQRDSGTSLRGKARLVKWGNCHLRAIFYMPALSAHRWNPIIARLRDRLLARGKSKMTVIVAIMRKLLHLCYGVLKTGKPFDPNHHQQLMPIA